MFHYQFLAKIVNVIIITLMDYLYCCWCCLFVYLFAYVHTHMHVYVHVHACTGTSKKKMNILKKVNIFCHSFQKVKPIYYIDSLHIE